MHKQLWIVVLLLLVEAVSIKADNVDTTSTYDWIVIGSGPGGATIARKLSDYFPDDKVLLLEAGYDNLDPLFTDETCSPVPHIFTSDNVTNCTYPAIISPRRFVTVPALKVLNSIPQVHADNTIIHFNAGNVLGGGTTINGGVAFRAPKDDLNYWAQLDPALEEFNYFAMLPYYKRIENNSETECHFVKPWTRFGNKGRVGITYDKVPSLYPQPIIEETAAKFGLRSSNINRYQIGGLSRVQRTVDYLSRRVSAATAYLDTEARRRRNFTILTKANCTRILFDKKVATGVEYIYGGKFVKAYVTKEVIVSAGAIESPAILKASGVGPKEELQALNIPVVLDLPTVGTNFHDKPLTVTQFYYNGINEKNDPAVVLTDEAFYAWKKDGSGPLGGTVIEFALHGGPRNFDAEFHEHAYLPITNFPTFNWIRLVCWNANTVSRGTIKLNPNGIYGPPLIDPNFYADPNDIENIVDCNFVTRAIYKDAGFSTGDLSPDSSVYASRDTLRAWVKNNTGPTYHNCGSNAIGGKTAVLDGRAKVRGLANVRVVDYSIAPKVLRVNPSYSLYALSEKIADYVREEYDKSYYDVSKVTLSFLCKPINYFRDDYTVWQVTNRNSRAIVYHWESNTKLVPVSQTKGSFAVDANSVSYFFTSIDDNQTVYLKLNNKIVTQAKAKTNPCY